MMSLVIFGPPGAGKGTYASMVGRELKLPVISTGDIFREEVKRDTDLGRKVAPFLNKGELIPDETVTATLTKRISMPDSRKGFILDGYPRTIEQAKVLDQTSKIDAVVLLVVPDWIILERLSNRRVCSQCGTIYNLKFLKPKRLGICDQCAGNLIQREDDTLEVIKERLKVYKAQTQPLIHYYKEKIPILSVECNSTNMSPEVVAEKILQELRKLNLLY